MKNEVALLMTGSAYSLASAFSLPSKQFPDSTEEVFPHFLLCQLKSHIEMRKAMEAQKSFPDSARKKLPLNARPENKYAMVFLCSYPAT